MATFHKLRRVMAMLVASSVATMPAVSLATVRLQAPPAAEHVSSHAGMPDCHGMKAERSGPAKQEKEHCPKCKAGVCTPDACQVKCSNAVGDLPREFQLAFGVLSRVRVPASTHFDAIHLRPPLPPPRA